MLSRNRFVILLSIWVVLALLLAGCTKTVTKEVPKEVTVVVEKVVTKEVPKEITRVVEKVVKDAAAPGPDVPFAKEWISSGHAQTDAVPFNYWNKADPVAVPKTCAKCHSTYGYQDFLGVDGTPPNVVDKDAKIGSVISCAACHNDATLAMTSVVFPSGLEVKGLGREARCMQCHQGRASTKTVEDGIKKLALKDADTVSPDLAFTNIHYFAAAASQMGTLAQGGYQYPGKTYDGKSVHVQGYDTCIDCHNPHSLEVRVKECATCHTNVKSTEDLKAIRMVSSMVDYDGDGDTKEGIYSEIEGLRNLLYQGIQAYAKQVPGKAIAYDAATHPYFFLDTNGDGKVSKEEAVAANRFNAFTPRLARAAYNYQTSLKDPGAFAHGGKYIIQLLSDSLEDLNAKLSQPIDTKKAHRIDDGHFAGSEEAFRRWDAEGLVPAACAKCHTGVGLPIFLRDNASIAQPPSNGLLCTTCHDSLSKYTRYQVKTVTFPSGAAIDSGNPSTNLCMNCHQGRESTTSVNRLIAGIGEDEKSPKLRFLNVHYFAAGATLFGTTAKGAYEYDGQKYVGRSNHVEAFANCTQCHSAHGLDVKAAECAKCHANVKGEEDLVNIRLSKTDYDGDGDTAEGLAKEIDALQVKVYEAIRAYASATAGAPLAYSATSYPYFFVDTNNNGKVDAEEAKSENGYKNWTPRLLKAAYNYQYASKDPGAFAHNGEYIIQVLYDSVENLKAPGVSAAGLVRP